MKRVLAIVLVLSLAGCVTPFAPKGPPTNVYPNGTVYPVPK